jgi:hypothetical protein
VGLEKYFQALIQKVEDVEFEYQNKDKDGFFEPTRVLVLQKLHMLKDLYVNQNAKPMLKPAWQYVVANLPPEWLILTEEEKLELKKILS